MPFNPYKKKSIGGLCGYTIVQWYQLEIQHSFSDDKTFLNKVWNYVKNELIIKISFDRNNLTGIIPPEICNLVNSIKFDL